jgi:hypothetical protein
MTDKPTPPPRILPFTPKAPPPRLPKRPGLTIHIETWIEHEHAEPPTPKL